MVSYPDDSTALEAYSTWNILPSGENVVAERSYYSISHPPCPLLLTPAPIDAIIRAVLYSQGLSMNRIIVFSLSISGPFDDDDGAEAFGRVLCGRGQCQGSQRLLATYSRPVHHVPLTILLVHQKLVLSIYPGERQIAVMIAPPPPLAYLRARPRLRSTSQRTTYAGWP